MEELKEEKRALRAVNMLKRVLTSRWLPFITAAVVLFCYYLGLDLIIIYYITITAVLCLLLLKDITPVIGIFIFMHCMISNQNSPSSTVTSSNYFLQPAVFGQLIACACIFGAAIVYRVILGLRKRTLKPCRVLWGLCALAAVFLLNGAFYGGYNPLNLFYGFAMAFLFLGIFALIGGNVKPNKDSFIRIAYAFAALSALLIIELVVVYLTSEGIFVNGAVDKTKIVFGWGIWNTMGMLLVLCVPFIFFLAVESKRSYLLYLYAILVSFATVMTMSRQSMLAIAIVFPICLILLFIKGENKKTNAIITAAGFLLALIVFIVKREELIYALKELLKNLVDSEGDFTGNGRLPLLQQAIDNWLAAPVFGKGFFVKLKGYDDFIGLPFIPDMCHNTFVQLLSSCGIIGLIAYIFHRIQTVASLFRRPTPERLFAALSVLGLLICSLFDNHIFYMFPTIIYSCIIALLAYSEKDVEISDH